MREITFVSETPNRRPLLRFNSFREPSGPTITPEFPLVRSLISYVPSSNRNPHISGIIDRTPLLEVIYNDTQSNEHLVSLIFSQMRTPSELNEITKVAFQTNRCYLNKEFY